MELLKQLYKIHSPSAKECVMIKFIRQFCKSMPGVIIKTDQLGNIYITKGKAVTYPCVVAHLDQVQDIHSRDFVAIETDEIIFGYSPKNRRQEGLGADDKNGIWIALMCLKKYDVLKIAFFVREEIGCIGSGKADIKFFSDCRFVIQSDRKGYQDIITSIGWTTLCSDDFLEDTGYKCFGYKESTGLMTDIQELKNRGLDISCINISCGYYEAHTDHEFTVKKDLFNALDLVEHIIENCLKVYTHINNTEDGSNKDYWDNYQLDYDEGIEMARDEIYELLDYEPDLLVDDIYLIYDKYYPLLKREDFETIYHEYHNQKMETYYGR